MKLKLTEKEIVLLGWDDPVLYRQDPDMGAVALKVRARKDLTVEELDAACREFEESCQVFGVDPADSATAKRLLRKVEKVRQGAPRAGG